MAFLEVTGGPKTPAGLTLTSSTKLIVRYQRPYSDNTDVYPQEYRADYDVANSNWKPEGSTDGTDFKLPGAKSGEPLPPKVTLIEQQRYSGAEGVDSYRELSGIYEDDNTADTWDYGSLPDGWTAVSRTSGGTIDSAEKLYDGTHTVTAEQARDHIDATNDPHSVTKTQVGLGSVTDDQQATKVEHDAHVAEIGTPHDLAGASVTDWRLKEWTESRTFESTSVTRDSDGVVTTATVQWPDGSTGTFTAGTKNDDWLCLDGFNVTHADSSKTVTQVDVTRNGDGEITSKPTLTVA